MTRTLFLAIIILSLTAPLASQAQSKLDEVIDQIESGQNCEVMYRETRDPVTRKVTRSTRLITFTDKNLAQRLINAFKKERENTVNYSVNEHRKSTIYRAEFNDTKSIKAEYSLIRDEKNNYTLSVKIENVIKGIKKSGSHKSQPQE